MGRTFDNVVRLLADEVVGRGSRRSGATNGSSVDSPLLSCCLIEFLLDVRLRKFDDAPYVLLDEDCDLSPSSVLGVATVVI
jgi:hypothetical protein